MKILKIEQNTDEWIEVRRGKITGSKLNDIVAKRGGKKLGYYELMADKLAISEAGEPEDPMVRGHRLEDEAADEFAKMTGKKLEKAGFCLSDDNENIALSPDRLIPDGDKYPEALEIKCLSTARHLQAYFEQAVESKYVPQAIQYFIVNKDLKTLYFAFYDPRVTAKPLHWIEFKRDELEKEIEFYTEYINRTLKEVEEDLTKIAF